MALKKYRITVENDEGKIVFLIPATSIVSARETIKKAEGCPDRAIVSVIPVPTYKLT